MRALLFVVTIAAALVGGTACDHRADPPPIVGPSDIVTPTRGGAGVPSPATGGAAAPATRGAAGPTGTGTSGAGARPPAAKPPANGAAPAGPVPAVLVGTWVSMGGGDAERVFRFGPDGVYRHAGVLLQQRPSGLYSIELAVRGRARAEGERLVLRPESGTITIKDPDSAESSGQRPADTAEERYSWRVGADDVLVMTSADGGTSQFRRDAGG